MNFIVDTHILIWSFTNPEKLKPKFQKILLNNDHTIYYSQFSLWEISIKYGIGKLHIKGINPEQLFNEVENSFFVCKKNENQELISFYKLPIEHKDPFDRAIIWQAIQNDFTLLSLDENLDLYKKHGLKFL
ncbi:MAG: type II toxin-antitoxin system VapC family toxin [Spirochaetales bacterium]|nr:type II toxin-antitoxin system VapC family toxin [Spirochaetales bacterium]